MGGKPKPLKPGDIVAVVAPASPVQEELFLAGVRQLERMGFQPSYTDKVFGAFRYLSGSDETRAGDLREAFLNPEVKAVFSARGGYGSMRLLALLDPAEIAEHPKVFLGSSDLTALLLFFAEKCGFPVIHGPMPATEIRQGETKYDRDLLLHLMTSPSPPGIIRVPSAIPLREGSARGILFGGCLSVLTSLLGTPFEPDTRGKILFLEDRNLKPYQIDRMMTQLKLAGKLDGVEGLIFGEMPGCVQSERQGYSLTEVLEELLAPYSFPALFGFPAGHTERKHIPLPIGLSATLDTATLSLHIEEPLVEP
jgi:muramoyltetrapeptide carboxypeptidase